MTQIGFFYRKKLGKNSWNQPRKLEYWEVFTKFSINHLVKKIILNKINNTITIIYYIVLGNVLIIIFDFVLNYLNHNFFISKKKFFSRMLKIQFTKKALKNWIVWYILFNITLIFMTTWAFWPKPWLTTNCVYFFQ